MYNSYIHCFGIGAGRQGPWIASPAEPSHAWLHPVKRLLNASPSGGEAVPEDPPLDISKLSFTVTFLGLGHACAYVQKRPLVLSVPQPLSVSV